jgi:outer membrane protein OmpA-like peptidoglycan-associated protein
MRQVSLWGHASAEGDYGQNLQLSQERAERISRELVRHGER